MNVTSGSANINDSSGSVDATIVVTLDGSGAVHAGIYSELESSSPKFYYTIDLRTGDIARL